MHKDWTICSQEAVNSGIDFVDCIDGKGIDLEGFGKHSEIGIIIQSCF